MALGDSCVGYTIEILMWAASSFLALSHAVMVAVYTLRQFRAGDPLTKFNVLSFIMAGSTILYFMGVPGVKMSSFCDNENVTMYSQTLYMFGTAGVDVSYLIFIYLRSVPLLGPRMRRYLWRFVILASVLIGLVYLLIPFAVVYGMKSTATKFLYAARLGETVLLMLDVFFSVVFYRYLRKMRSNVGSRIVDPLYVIAEHGLRGCLILFLAAIPASASAPSETITIPMGTALFYSSLSLYWALSFNVLIMKFSVDRAKKEAEELSKTKNISVTASKVLESIATSEIDTEPDVDVVGTELAGTEFPRENNEDGDFHAT